MEPRVLDRVSRDDNKRGEIKTSFPLRGGSDKSAGSVVGQFVEGTSRLNDKLINYQSRRRRRDIVKSRLASPDVGRLAANLVNGVTY